MSWFKKSVPKVTKEEILKNWESLSDIQLLAVAAYAVSSSIWADELKKAFALRFNILPEFL